jgi:large subunit ribosomal protein L17
MDASARKAMLRNMVTSLMIHGQIRTTQARAKELRGYAEKVVSLAKRAPTVEDIESLKGASKKQEAQATRIHAIRRVRRWVNNDGAVEKLFGEYAQRYANRPGGYTRVVKGGIRPGDNADMAIIQLVGDYEPTTKKATAKKVEKEEPVEVASSEETPVEAAPVEAAQDASSEETSAQEGAVEE